jgi:hypothetical protein
MTRARKALCVLFLSFSSKGRERERTQIEESVFRTRLLNRGARASLSGCGDELGMRAIEATPAVESVGEGRRDG